MSKIRDGPHAIPHQMLMSYRAKAATTTTTEAKYVPQEVRIYLLCKSVNQQD